MGTDFDKTIYDGDGSDLLADGKGILLMGTDGTNIFPLLTDATGQLAIGATIAASDIQIGAVELKDATTAARAIISAGGSLQVLDDNSAALLVDTNAMVVDLAAIEVLLTSIDADTAALVVDLAALEVLNTDIKTAVELLDDTVGTIDTAFSGKVLVQGGKAESTIPTEVADADAVATWFDTFGRQILHGANLATGSMDVSEVAPVADQSGYLQIIDQLLDDSPTTVTSTAFFIGNKNKVSFILESDITDIDASSPQVTYTFEVSPDNSTWYAIDVVMGDGGEDAPISSVVHAADGVAIAYLPMGFCAQYIRVVGTGANTDANDTVQCDVYLMWKQG